MSCPCMRAVALFAALAGLSSASAQVTVRIDQAPQRVAPGETFEVAWTVFAADPVDLTAVVWGTQAGTWDQIGDRLSGQPGAFRTRVTAPVAAGAMLWVVYVRAGTYRGTTAEQTIQVAAPRPSAETAKTALSP